MNALRQLLLFVVMAAVALVTPSARASLSAAPSSNQLYLVISNSAGGVFLTAYNTVPNVSYQIQTNTDVTNPNGWGAWVTVLASNTVTPLASLGLDSKETFFRAVTASGSGSASTQNLSAQYLGRLDITTNHNQTTPTAELAGATNQSTQTLSTWGLIANPDGDCNFYANKDSVVISVPGSDNPHDLAAEIDRTNAPRVTAEIDGDFTIQVKTDGRYEPGEISTQAGRTAYNGAALIVTLDPNNVVTLARAVLQFPGHGPAYYANFELRSAGKLHCIGYTGDCPLPAKGPIWLRLQRKGAEVFGAVSLDGNEWRALGKKAIPAEWPGKLSAGIAAISTSEYEFDPRFSELKISK